MNEQTRAELRCMKERLGQMHAEMHFATGPRREQLDAEIYRLEDIYHAAKEAFALSQGLNADGTRKKP